MPVYFMQAIGGGPIKIGHSKDVEKRQAQLEARYGRPLVVVHIIEGDRGTEQAIHQKFARLRIRQTEQFRVGRDLIEFIGKPLTTRMSGRRMCPKKVNLTVSLPDGLHARIKRIADRECNSVATFIRAAVAEKLERMEPKGSKR